MQVIDIQPNKKSHRFILSLIAAFYLINACLSFYLLNETKQDAEQEQEAISILLLLEKIGRAIVDAETGQRGYVLTGDRAYLEPYFEAVRDIPGMMSDLRIKSGIRVDSRNNIDQLELFIQAKLDEVKESLDLMEADQKREVVKKIDTDLGLELMKEIDNLINTMTWNYYNFIVLSNQSSDKKLWFSLMFIVPTSLLGVVMVMLFLFYLERSLNQQHDLQLSLLESKEHLEQRVEERTKELLQKSEELERSNQELENFAYVASHDLQEPLRKIQAFADRLKSKYAASLDEKGEDYLERMKAASIRMSQLIQDLLLFSRVSSRDMELRDVDLNELVGELVEGFEETLKERDTIVFHGLPVVRGDYSQLSRVFTNLLSNAIKYRKPDADLHIEIQTEVLDEEQVKSLFEVPAADQYFKILIKDNGIGFDMAYAGKIFTMFQRLHGRSSYEGTGIGLAIIKKIAERHLGTVRVHKAEENVGAEFALYLPKYGDQNE